MSKYLAGSSRCPASTARMENSSCESSNVKRPMALKPAAFMAQNARAFFLRVCFLLMRCAASGFSRRRVQSVGNESLSGEGGNHAPDQSRVNEANGVAPTVLLGWQKHPVLD